MSILKIKLLQPNAQPPARATSGSAGYDLCAALDQAVIIEPGETAWLPSGFAMELSDSGYVGLVFARSSLGAKHGVLPPNGVGVIDSDYRGEVKVVLKNTSSVPFTVNPGDRVAQLVIVPVETPDIEVCDSLCESDRGTGGFGSTGR